MKAPLDPDRRVLKLKNVGLPFEILFCPLFSSKTKIFDQNKHISSFFFLLNHDSIKVESEMIYLLLLAVEHEACYLPDNTT